MSLPRKQYVSVGPVSCSLNLHDDQFISPRSGEAIAIGGYLLANRSNATCDVGLFEKLPHAFWEAGTLTAASTPDFLTGTATAQSTSANAFVNVFTATNASGFLLQAQEKFHAFSCVVDDATATTGANILVQYYNGTSYANCAELLSPDFTTASAAKTQAIFAPGSDWVVGTNAAVGGSTSLWSIRVISVDATGGSVCSISDVRLYKMIDFYPQMATNNQLVDDLQDQELQIRSGGALCAYFGGTANAANYVMFDYRPLSRNV